MGAMSVIAPTQLLSDPAPPTLVTGALLNLKDILHIPSWMA